MTKRLPLIFTFLIIATTAFSQSINDSLANIANSLYKKHDFAKAAPAFERVAEKAEIAVAKNTYYFYAAIIYADAKDAENSFRCLDLAINKYGYNDDVTLKGSDDFDFMQADKRWNTLIGSIKIAYSTDPLKARFIDSDVRLFWKAYDMVQKDTAHAWNIYRQEYINKGSIELQEYYMYKIYNLNSFTIIHKQKQKFYASIRSNTLQALKYKDKYVKGYVALKALYPSAIFPNVYFVVGKLNSAGMPSSNGLILGVDQMSRTATTDVSEFAPGEMHYLTGFEGLPSTVAHELIHFQQKAMAQDTTLLCGSIQEGMADFIGELTSGQSSNARLVKAVKGKERKIWEDFKKEMYLDRKGNWIANGDQETPDHPADLGYWVGYRICKAYYDKQTDKKKAIYDMLHLQDYKRFLEMSRLDEELK